MSVITFRGITSTSKNAIVTAYPEIIKPVLDHETVEVPGRHGELRLMGTGRYEALSLECEILVAGADIQGVTEWLQGTGDLVLGNDPGFAYEAWVEDEIRFLQASRGRDYYLASVVFLCQPLRKKVPAESDIVLTASGFITNPGSVPSRPRIRVEGSGNITLMVGTQILEIKGLTQTMVIDCDGGIALDTTGGLNMSYLVSGAWPKIKPGSNSVGWTGNVSKLTITPRWRYL